MAIQPSPINPDFIQFARVIHQELAISESCVDEFLVFIGCHEKLKALVTLCKNLQDVLPYVKALSVDDQLTRSIPLWQQICLFVINHAGQLSEDFPDISIKSGSVKRAPFPKQFEQYPLYIALWYRYPDTRYGARYRLLQALLLVSQYVFRQREEKEEKHFDSISLASTRLIRQFAEQSRPEKVQTLLPLLSDLPEKVDSLEEYLDFILQIQEDGVDYAESLKSAIDILRRMLVYVVMHKGGYSRRYNRVWEAIQNREAIRQQLIKIDPEDEQGLDFSVELIQMHSQTEKEEQQSKAAGCAPGEVKTGVEHLIINDEQDARQPMAGRSPVAHIRRVRDKHSAIAMSNQLLGHRWGILSVYELTVFLSEVSNLIRDKRHIALYSDFVSQYELAALLTAIYWTGNPLKTVCEYRFELSQDKLPKNLDATDHRFVIESHEWVHGSLRPAYKSKINQCTSHFVHSTYSKVNLPIQNATDRIINKWIILIEDERKKKRGKRLFEQSEKRYSEAIKAFLQRLNRQYKTRLTLTRIANDMMERLYQQSNDLVEAMIITGREHYLGDISLHYATPPLDRLQTIYQKTCKQISQAVYQTLNKPLPNSKENVEKQRVEESKTTYTGGRYYLKPGKVGELVNHLIVRFNETLKFPGFNDYWCELHNQYTLYVAEMLGFASGYRAVRNPLECINQIDWHTGFACISDKDDLDYYNARLVWLPEMVRNQLQCYQQHCQILGERLMLINPRLAQKLIRHGQSLEYTAPFLFMMKPNGHLLKLSPAEIKKQLDTIFPVPCNVNRSYLRNRLRELGCPGEIVNYFLGHWENGQEPFGVYATLSPGDYKAQIAPHLETILHDDGWRIIKGFATHINSAA